MNRNRIMESYPMKIVLVFGLLGLWIYLCIKNGVKNL